MNLLGKIKDILFNDEEVEDKVDSEELNIPEKEPMEPKPVKQEKKLDFGEDFELPVINKKPENKEPEVEERDLFKANNTFNFPVDVQEDEFVPLEMPKRSQNNYYQKEETKRVDVEKYVIKKRKL